MDYDRNRAFGKRKASPGLGLGASKKQHFAPDFSALPTHLPCKPGPFASIVSSPSTPEVSPGVAEPKTESKRDSGAESSAKIGLGFAPRARSQNGPVGDTINDKADANIESEDEESIFKSGKGPQFIEGTNISLQTDEDIAKWIAERKKKWPTRKNVEAKLQERTEKAPEQSPATPKQNICKFYARNKRCKFGSKCRHVHENGTGNPGNATGTSSTRKMINGVLVNIPQRYKKEVNGAGSLFTKLVQRDLYEHENNIIVDFIQYLESQGLVSKNAEMGSA